MSGAKDKRPALDRLMADARRGKFDIVAVWRFDRFARSTSHLLRALEEFQALGIDFVSLRESIDTSSPTGKAMFTILGAISELERCTIRERVMAGQKGTSNTLSKVVTKATTTTTLLSSINPSVQGKPVTFTASVSSLAGTPTGKAQFLNGTKVLATVTRQSSQPRL